MARTGRVYKYFDGQKTRHVDPFALHRRFTDAVAGRDLSALLRDAFPPETDNPSATVLPQVRNAAWLELIEVAQKALTLHPIDEDTGEGLNEDEMMAALMAVCQFFQGEKKDTAAGPNVSPPSGSTLPDENGTPAPTSAVGLTAEGSKSSGPP